MSEYDVRGYLMAGGKPKQATQVNWRLQRAFRGVQLVKGRGYWYFVGEMVERAPSTSVMVPRIGDLSFAQWMQAAADVINEAYGSDLGTVLLNEALAVADQHSAYLNEHAQSPSADASPARWQAYQKRLNEARRQADILYMWPGWLIHDPRREQ